MTPCSFRNCTLRADQLVRYAIPGHPDRDYPVCHAHADVQVRAAPKVATVTRHTLDGSPYREPTQEPPMTAQTAPALAPAPASPATEAPRRRRNVNHASTCIMPGCFGRYHAYGLCSTHGTRARRAGILDEFAADPASATRKLSEMERAGQVPMRVFRHKPSLLPPAEPTLLLPPVPVTLAPVVTAPALGLPDDRAAKLRLTLVRMLLRRATARQDAEDVDALEALEALL